VAKTVLLMHKLNSWHKFQFRFQSPRKDCIKIRKKRVQDYEFKVEPKCWMCDKKYK